MRRELKQQEIDWINSRPDVIKKMIKIAPPNAQYKMKGLDEPFAYYVPYSYSEDGTMTVTKVYVDGILPSIVVFGVLPDDLIELK